MTRRVLATSLAFQESSKGARTAAKQTARVETKLQPELQCSRLYPLVVIIDACVLLVNLPSARLLFTFPLHLYMLGFTYYHVRVPPAIWHVTMLSLCKLARFAFMSK